MPQQGRRRVAEHSAQTTWWPWRTGANPSWRPPGHVGLSAVVLPLIFSSFFFSLSGRFRQHRKVSRYTFPVWMYVSVTGVLVFLLLRAYS